MCGCIKKLNKMLKEHNTVLSEVSMLSMKTGKCRQSLVIASQKIDTKRGSPKPKTVLPSYCPFCGKRSAPFPSKDGRHG